MKKAAICIDDWKLPVFRKILDAEGYKYTETNALNGVIILSVSTENIAKLVPVVELMNKEAAKIKMQ